MGNVNLSIATVPEGTCYGNPQTDWPLMVSYMSASVQGSLNLFNFGNSVPSAADRTKPWIRTNSDGTPDGTYVYSGGYWLKAHQMPTGAVIMWEGAIASLDAFDGGETAAVTTISGPFWEEVTEMQARSPIHPGTLPSTTVLSVNNDYGEESHQLTVNEMPAHTHPFDTTNGAQVLAKVTSGKVNDINQTGSLDYAFANAPQNTGGDAAHNTIHPVRGIYFIRRTARLYYRI